MLRRYIDIEKINLALSKNIYTIHKDGKVYNQHGVLVTSSTIPDGDMDIPIENVINYAFKCPKLDCWSIYRTMKVSFVDGNINNRHPDNLYWNNTNITDINGFRPIPGYSRYLINRNGEVINVALNKKMSPYIDKYGYYFYGLTPDVGKRLPVGRHRLMALAFLDIPPNFYELDINHKNGNKKDNSVDNLEWCSRQHNVRHAIYSGLRNDNKPVLMRDVLTDKVTEYVSIGECERLNGYKKQCVGNRVKSKGKITYPDYRQFCVKDEFDGWGEVNPKDITRSGIPRRLIVSQGGNVITFPSIKQLAVYLKINESTVKYRLKNGIYEFCGVKVTILNELE